LQFGTDYAKYVDDTTISSVSEDPLDNTIQLAANHLSTWSINNGMHINNTKTKEMIIHFGSNPDNLQNITINGKQIETINNFKLLGVIISSDLSWNAHVAYILNKTAKRMYCIRYLVRANVKEPDILKVYTAIIRSILEYACPVWHPGLSNEQSKEIERVQKRCLRLIYPSLSYNEALAYSGLERLSDRRETITCNMFCELKDPNHVLHSLLPKRNITCSMSMRNSYPYHIPITKTTRYGRAFIPYCISR